MVEIKFRKISSYKYILEEDYKFQSEIKGFSVYTKYIRLTPDGLLVVKAGYAWDGASGPTIDDETNYRFSLIHDVLYQLLRGGLIPYLYRKYADSLVLTVAREDGMKWFRRWKWYIGLRKFGWPWALPEGGFHDA